jgi:hypothetical protein
MRSSDIQSNYVTVSRQVTAVPMEDEPEKKETRVLNNASPSVRPSVASSMISNALLKNKTYKILLCSSGFLSSATSLQLVAPVAPTASPEYSALEVLFQEVRVTGGRLHFSMWAAAGSTAATFGGVAFSNTSETVITSVTSLCVHPQKKLLCVPPTSTSASLPMPLAATESGFYTMNFKVRPGAIKSSTFAVSGEELASGYWADTRDTTNVPVFGFLKSYLPAVTGVTWGISYVMEMDCEFRSRF